MTTKMDGDVTHGSGSYNTFSEISPPVPPAPRRSTTAVSREPRQYTKRTPTLSAMSSANLTLPGRPKKPAQPARVGVLTPGPSDSAATAIPPATALCPNDTALRHGNYEDFNKSVSWTPPSQITRSASLYLTSKPSFFRVCLGRSSVRM